MHRNATVQRFPFHPHHKLACLFLACLLIAGGGWNCRNKTEAATQSRRGARGKTKGKKPSWRRKARPKPVHIMTIRRGDLASVLTGTTTLQAEEQVNIITQVNGLTKRIYGQEGSRFRKGDVLAVLRNPYLQITYERTQLQVRKLKRDLERNNRLLAKGLVSKEATEELNFRLAQARNELKRAIQNLRDLKIRATIRGVITQRRLRKGAWTAPNQVAFSMEDPQSLIAKIAVPEKYLPQLKVGLSAKLQAEALGRDSFLRGRVLRIAPTVDSKTGTIALTVGQLNPLKQLRSGMFVTVNLILQRRTKIPLLPKKAVLYDNNRPTVYRVLGDLSTCRSKAINLQNPAATPPTNSKPQGRPSRGARSGPKESKEPKGCAVQKVHFRKGIEDANWLEIKSGLQEGDHVVVLGQDDLHSQSRVLVGKSQ